MHYNVPAYRLLDAEGLERLHQASLHILVELGIDFHDDEVCSLFRRHGARVDGRRVWLTPDLVEAGLARAPQQFVQLARNPARNLSVGGEHCVCAPVYGPPFVFDRERGRRPATLADFQNFVRLAYLSPYLHHSGGTLVEPTDRPLATRHLDMVYSHIKYSDKAFMGSVTSAENAADSVAMAELVFGPAMYQQPALIALINVNSPRLFDARMLGALKVYARARQALIITPFVLAGAMAPATVAGTLAQQNAEVLAGIVLTQLLEPGTPVVYGSFMTNVDFKSGAPVFGSPESQLGIMASAQLARRYGLPFRGGGMLTSAKIPDAQAAAESLMVMLPTLMAGTNFVLHAAGWLEGGLVAGYEKFVLDCEILGMLHTWAKGVDLSDEGLALEAIAEVSPGGQYLAAEHTLRHFRTAFYRAELFDYRTVEQWAADGAQDACQRAGEQVRRLLVAYEPAPLDPAIEEALLDYMARRTAGQSHPAS